MSNKEIMPTSVEEFISLMTKIMVEAERETKKDTGEKLLLDVMDFLECKEREIIKIELEEDEFWINSLIEAVDHVIKKEYNVEFVRAYDNIQWDRVAPSYTLMEIAPKVFKKKLKSGAFYCTDNEGNKFVINMTFNRGDLEVMIFNDTSNEDHGNSIYEKIKERYKKNSMYKNRKINSKGEFLDLKEHDWNDIIIAPELLREIKDNIIFPLHNLDKLGSYGLPQSRGILLEGPPGTGKTLLSTIIANKVDCTFISVSPSEIHGSQSIKEIYENARFLSPCIVFFEDIDAIAKSKDSVHGSLQEKVLGELMLQLDGVEKNEGVFTLATTNYPGIIEDSLTNRPGRIDRRLKMEIPNMEEKEGILNILLGKKIKLGDDIEIKTILRRTEGFTGAALRELVYVAVVEALKKMADSSNTPDVDLNLQHIETALRKVKKEKTKYKDMYV